MNTYSQGDMIHHPLHGIGQVTRFEKKELLGSELRFAILYFSREKLEVSLPANRLEEAVRNPLTAAKAKELLDGLEECEEKPDKNWKSRNRANQERLKSGDPQEVFKVFSTLEQLKRSKGSLNNSDRKQRALAMDLLIEELSMVLELDPEKLEAMLEASSLESTQAA